jgi:nucleoside-diphosphate-sugar epimerase
MAKKAAETLCVSFGLEYGVETVIARSCHVYGAAVTPNDNRATAQFLKNARRHEPIVMHSKGLMMRSYIYVADCASAILTILVNGKDRCAYNIANRKSCLTIADFAGRLARQAGVAVESCEPDAEEKQELTPIEYAVLDPSRLEALGWQGRYDIDTGIRRMYEIAAGKGRK